MREQPKISTERLKACLQDNYNLSPTTLEYLPLGLDYRAGVYRVVSEQGTPYLLKVKSGGLYEPGCIVPGRLSAQGLASVVAPMPTRSGDLWTYLDEWAVLIYPFIDGNTGWAGMTDEQWKEVGAIFHRIHRATLPSAGLESLRRETFVPTEYVQWIHTFETRYAQAPGGKSASQLALHSSWMAHRNTIHKIVAIMEELAGVLRSRSLPFVVCHADLHPANLLCDRSGRVFVIDWDDVMLAPKERDFLFIQVSQTESTLPGALAFFQGYGQAEIDWIALTYYRYERVVQDLIASAQEVFFRDDLGEETRADSVRLFQMILAGGFMIDAAFQASTHLPSDLSVAARRAAQIESELTER